MSETKRKTKRNNTSIEIQKVGYLFPGQRCACYSADMLLRQYKRVRSEKKKFKKFSEDYLHTFYYTSDTGLEMNLLQKFYFVPLDIFQKNLQNKGIKSKLDAWLTFLSTDEPEWIIKLIEEYLQFMVMYQELYEICRNVEMVMDMFSSELREMDRNTEEYMVDIMQEKISQQKQELNQLNLLLLKDNKIVDLPKLMEDIQIQGALLKEYQL